MNKLHLGVGKNYIPGFVNVDIFSSVVADLYADVQALPLPPVSFDLIYASHVLEHVHRNMVIATLSHWRSLLKPGGVLRLAVPDFRAVCNWYEHHGPLDDVMGLLYGGQNHPKNNHFVIFDESTLRRDLLRAGFKDTRMWDWRDTEHSQYDDYSQASLPCDEVTRKPLDKTNGLLVSLNMEGINQ